MNTFASDWLILPVCDLCNYLLLVNHSLSLSGSCTIQNCVISDKVVIENNCNLNECHIGHGYRVTAGTKNKNELFSAAH